MRILGFFWDILWDLLVSFEQGPVEVTGTRGSTVLYVIPQETLSQECCSEAASRYVPSDQLPPVADGHIRLVVLSDTHQRHRGFALPAGDVLLHCGDVLAKSRYASQEYAESVLKDFSEWLEQVPCPHRLVIGGNHDVALQQMGPARIQELLGSSGTYLEFQSTTVKIPRRQRVSDSSEGPGTKPMVELRIYGAPISQGASANKAWQGAEFEEQFAAEAPDSADVVFTHGPVLSQGQPKGKLGTVVQQLAPLLHAHGHTHDDYGEIQSLPGRSGAISVNAAVMKSVPSLLPNQRPENPPLVIDLPFPPAL